MFYLFYGLRLLEFYRVYFGCPKTVVRTGTPPLIFDSINMRMRVPKKGGEKSICRMRSPTV